MFTTAAGVGSSQDSFKAGVEAALNARAPLGQTSPSLGIVFAAPTYNQVDMLRGIASVIGSDVLLVGASTAGEITNYGPSKVDSVTVMLLASDTVGFYASLYADINKSDDAAGHALYTDFISQTKEDIQLVMMFADGLTANPVGIIRGIQTAAGRNVPIVGGSAGDNGALKKTFQYYKGEVYTDAVVALAFTGDIAFSVGVRHGWIPIGAPKKVTAAAGNLLQEIDGKPAIELYKKFLGEAEAKHLGEVALGEIALSYPLGVKDPATGTMLLRAPFFVDHAGSITCGGEFQVGDSVQLMIGSKEEALKAAKESAQQASDGLGVKPAGAVIFSCHVRHTLFGTNEKSSAEVRAITDVIGAGVPMIGFYTYSEQAPINGETKNLEHCNPSNHNETLVTVLLGEKI